MSGFTRVSGYRLAQWRRRADTLHRKAQDLLSDMISQLGLEDPATDYSDAIVERCEELGGMLDRWAASQKPGQARTDGGGQ